MRFEDVVKGNLLAVADAYRAATGLSEVTISGRFHGQNRFLGDLRRGAASVGVDKLGAMLRAFSDAWPPKTPWPETRSVSMRRQRGAEIVDKSPRAVVADSRIG